MGRLGIHASRLFPAGTGQRTSGKWHCHLLVLAIAAILLAGCGSASVSKYLPPVTPAANPDLETFQAKFSPPRLVPMGPRVTMAFGYDYANFTFIEGDTGVIVVDTGMYTNPAARALADYRKKVKKPVVAIIYTHVHADHRGGTKTFLAHARGDIPIYAPEGSKERYAYDVSGVMPMVVRRGVSQFGMLLPDGEKGSLGAGIGPSPRVDGQISGVLPTDYISGPKQITLSGVTFELVPAAADVTSHMMVWLPDEKVLISGDLLGGTLPYVATARFEKERTAAAFVESLDKALAYPAQYLIPGHGRPVMGEKDVKDVLTVNRDCCQFLDNQVTRYVAKGYSADEIIDVLELPPNLASHPDLQPHYHKLDWLIRGMYLKRAGWLGRTISMIRHTDSEEARRLVALLGGADQAAQQALSAYEKKDYPWAARLADQVLMVKADHFLAYQVKTNAFKQIAYTSESANERNYLLTRVLELENQYSWEDLTMAFGSRILPNMPSRRLLELMVYRFRAEAAPAEGMVLDLRVLEESPYTIEVRNGVMLVEPGSPSTPDAAASLSRAVLVDLSIGRTSWSDAMKNKKIVVEKGRDVMVAFASLMEKSLVKAVDPAPLPGQTKIDEAVVLRGELFDHEDFSISYPDSFSVKDPEEGTLFTAKGGFMGIPKMVVRREKQMATADALAQEFVAKLEAENKATNCQVILSKEVQLTDGTPAVEVMVLWDHPMVKGLFSSRIVAGKTDNVFSVTMTDKKEINAEYRLSMRSLLIK